VPYVLAGVAGYTGNPRGENAQGNIVDLQPLKTEGVSYNRGGIAIPFGGGARYKINKSFDLGFEIVFRKTFNDYLDDVSTNYVSGENQLSSDNAKYFGWRITGDSGPDQAGSSSTWLQESQGGYKRGESKEDDWYVTAGFTLNYILAPRIKSPKFR
jgi:hypothetical protein